MSDIPSLPPVESASPVQPRPSAWRRPSVIIAAVALALLGWQWAETRSRLADLQEDLARRLTDGDTAAKEARALARQAQENLQDLQGKVGALDAKLSESQGQQVALEAMYQEFSRSRDDRVLAEVEQAVAIAAQQLQLAGNVHAALFALQAADARLGSVDRPQWLPLRKAIAADLDTLKALPQVDSSGIALKLETLIGRLDRLQARLAGIFDRAGQGKLGRLDIGIFGTSVLGAIPQILQRFRDEHPDVRVVLHTMSKHEQLAALRQRRITIGFNRMLTPQPDICTKSAEPTPVLPLPS